MSLLQKIVSSEYRPVAARGVVYFSRIPRDMRPNELRVHFQQYGECFRQKFVPFPVNKETGRKPQLQFKEGWLEFKRAEDAERAAAAMNMQPVDVKRKRKAYGELWNVKFLAGFTWDNLVTEREERIREAKQREFSARRIEQDVNEQFRAMVAAARKQRSQSSSRPLERRSAPDLGDSEEKVTTTSHGASPPQRPPRHKEERRVGTKRTRGEEENGDEGNMPPVAETRSSGGGQRAPRAAEAAATAPPKATSRLARLRAAGGKASRGSRQVADVSSVRPGAERRKQRAATATEN